MCYIPSLNGGHNVLKEFYTKYISEDMSQVAEKTVIFDKESYKYDYDKLYKVLEENGIIFDIDETDVELEFKFNSKDLDKIDEIMKLSRYGASIKPLSTRNLPKRNESEKYIIPDDDLKQYNDLLKDIPHKDKLQVLLKFTREIEDIIAKEKGNNYNFKAERKKVMLKTKEFVHSLGLWDLYIESLRKFLKNNK